MTIAIDFTNIRIRNILRGVMIGALLISFFSITQACGTMSQATDVSSLSELLDSTPEPTTKLVREHIEIQRLAEARVQAESFNFRLMQIGLEVTYEAPGTIQVPTQTAESAVAQR